jgi:hypothetical protein
LSEDDEPSSKRKKKKLDNEQQKYKDPIKIKIEPTVHDEIENKDDNMILIKSDDSIWKTSDGKSASLDAEIKRTREDDFLDYLEDLLI